MGSILDGRSSGWLAEAGARSGGLGVPVCRGIQALLVLYLVPVLLLVLICGGCLIAIGGLATATRRATCWLARGQKLEIAGIGRSAAPGGNFEEA